MRALIMSDSHGWNKEVKEIVERHQHEVDAIFHCGDSELNGSSEALDGVLTVSGNCDFGRDFPDELTKDINGLRFFIAHGHLLNVKMNSLNLVYKGEEAGATIICFGHTHIPVAFQEKDMVFLNPGSMRLPRKHPEGTYVLVEKEKEQVHVKFFSLDGEIQEYLSKKFFIKC